MQPEGPAQALMEQAFGLRFSLKMLVNVGG
jgi:hypothetical protein